MKTRSKPDANSIFECLEEIATKARGSEFSDEFLLKVKPYSDKLASFLECQSREAVWFAIIFCINFRTHSVDLDDLSSYLECHPLKIVRFNDFDNLIKLRLIRKDSEENRRRRNRCGDRINALKFYVPKDVMVAISDGEKPNQTVKPNDLTVYEFLDGISDIVEEKDSEIINYRDMISEVRLLMDDNVLPLVKNARQLKLSDEDLILLLFTLSQFVNYESSIDLIRTIRVIFPSDIQFSIRRAFVQGKSNLQVKNLIQLASEDFKTDKTVELTEKAIDMFIPAEDKTLFLKRENKKMDVIYPQDITAKQLYFNPELTKSLQFLTESLQPANFKLINSRLQQQGLKNNFSVLLYGSGSGTGKTEFCKQLAKQTSRPLKMVIISESKSSWFGQSEKLIKGIFDDYKKMVTYSDVTPILFFNECDAIFSTRKKHGNSSTSQTEHSLQNILLQELEELNGILVCTSNLISSLDPAFSRRFLMKIEFDKPSVDAKFHIWKDKIPTLTDNEAMCLAEKYSLSGGEIDNCSRKYQMNQIVYGKTPDIFELEQYCQSESLNKNTEWKRIGFIR